MKDLEWCVRSYLQSSGIAPRFHSGQEGVKHDLNSQSEVLNLKSQSLNAWWIVSGVAPARFSGSWVEYLWLFTQSTSKESAHVIQNRSNGKHVLLSLKWSFLRTQLRNILLLLLFVKKNTMYIMFCIIPQHSWIIKSDWSKGVVDYFSITPAHRFILISIHLF